MSVRGRVCSTLVTVTEAHSPGIWDVALDRGGTFTDVVATSDLGATVCTKVLSGPGSEATAVHKLLEVQGGQL